MSFNHVVHWKDSGDPKFQILSFISYSITCGFTPLHPLKMGWERRREETRNLQVFENLMPKQVKKLLLASYCHPGTAVPGKVHCSIVP